MKKLNDVAKEVIKAQDQAKKPSEVEISIKSCPECGCDCKSGSKEESEED